MKSTDQSYKIVVDIIVNAIDHVNFQSSSQNTTEIIKHCVKVYPTFLRNIIFLKFFLSYKQLNSSYLGGLNSYGLSLLYVAYIESKNI